MTRRFPLAFVLLTLITTAGCRQADGLVPTPGGDDPNRIDDMTRGLMAIAATNEQATDDLAGDLLVWTDEVDGAVPATRDLARMVIEAVRGHALSEESSRRLAQTLWMTSSARDLSDRQVGELQQQLRQVLDAIGAPAEKSEAAAQQAGALQRIVTDRARRWYELF